MRRMPKFISAPSRLEALGTPPKIIDEYIGRVNTRTEVVSIAQLGTRLHALLDRSVVDPALRVRDALARAHVAAAVEHTSASLEDVFVAATGGGRRDQRAGGARAEEVP